jgi:hypothetical protein
LRHTRQMTYSIYGAFGGLCVQLFMPSNYFYSRN